MGAEATLRWLFAIFTITTFTLPTLSFAQPAESASNDEIEEILVVARNVEESIQEAPVAVSVIGQETLDLFRIDEATDLLSRIPALNVSVGGSGAGAQITLRGIGSSSISNAFDSAVALNYDGISVSTQRLLLLAFFDVEQVAVLKGPQSLYFGKAASAGVLSLRSANPTDDWEFGVKTSYEFEEDGLTFGGYASGPITDTLGVRIAGEYQGIDEFVRIAPGNPTLYPDRGLDNLITRATFHWEPTDRFTANLKLNYTEQRSDTLNNSLDIFCGGDGLPDPSVLLSGLLGGTPGLDLFLPTHDCDIDDGRFTGPDGNALIDTVPAGSPGEGRDFSRAYNDTDTFFARLKMDFALNENFDLTILSGYLDLDNEYNDTFNSTGQNPDGSAAGLVAPFENTLEQITLEARLASNFDGPFNFQVGGFWEDRDIGHRTSQNAFNPSLLEPLGPIFGLPFGPDPLTGYTFDWLADRPIDAEALSFFASASIELSEKWELSGGVRWTDEKKSTSISFPFVHAGVVGLFGTVTSGFQTDDIKFEDDNVSPEVVLRYLVNDNLSIYGAYKTGFKSGGVDNNTLPTGSVVGLIDPDPAVREAAEDLLKFESEESKGWEVGLRSQFLDRALTLNLTGYRYVYENQQVQIFDPAVFAFSTFNAGEVTTAGLDVDFVWATAVPGLTISGSWAFLDAEITGDLFGPSGENLKGRDGGSAPEISGNVAINWETNITDSLRLRISPNIAYKDDYFVGGSSRDPYDPVTNPFGDLVQDSYITLDLNVSLFAADNSWRLSLIGRNLTDEQYLTFAGPAPFRPLPGLGLGAGDDQLVGIGRGMQIFVEAAFEF
jgi:iron complex outermembrane receptor protein